MKLEQRQIAYQNGVIGEQAAKIAEAQQEIERLRGSVTEKLGALDEMQGVVFKLLARAEAAEAEVTRLKAGSTCPSCLAYFQAPDALDYDTAEALIGFARCGYLDRPTYDRLVKALMAASVIGRTGPDESPSSLYSRARAEVTRLSFLLAQREAK